MPASRTGRGSVRVWIDGSWGVDALSGERLRGHDDLDGLAGTGSIGGRRVRCLTPELQMRVHAGYELGAKDHAEIRILHERLGVATLAGYEPPETGVR